jgi:branched-chain amino acid transport system ATP-binding protein
MSDSDLLAVTDLDVRYGPARALNGVSLRLPERSTTAVLGVNGAGKSTLARAVSGLVPIHGGRVLLDGRDVTSLRPHHIRKLGVVHLSEGAGVFPSLTVADNVHMSVLPLPRKARRAAIDAAFDFFPQLTARRHLLAGRLSGGERQMLSLARALAGQPRVIIADELSLGLAPIMVDTVFDGLDRIRQRGASIILIEQYVHRALAFADSCVLLQRGQVTWAGPTSQARPETLERFLGGTTAPQPDDSAPALIDQTAEPERRTI